MAREMGDHLERGQGSAPLRLVTDHEGREPRGVSRVRMAEPADADVRRAREGRRSETGEGRVPIVRDELHPGAAVSKEPAGLVERQRACELEIHVDAVTD